MAFWTFCCKPWQRYTLDGGVDGSPARTVDNEGNWSALLGSWAIQNGELWFLGAAGGFNKSPGYSRRIGTSSAWTGFGIYAGDDLPPGDPGLYVMSGGAPYAFGGTMAGTGLVPRASASIYTTRYRARLSSAVESVSIRRVPGDTIKWFGKKPALSIVSVWNDGTIVENEPGSGAVIDCDFFPTPWLWAVTSGGSGYTSPPSVILTPSHADDAGATGTASVSRMANVPIVGFAVTSAGSGYTEATATDRYTGAKATAVIEDGEIVSWSLTSAGSRLVNPLSLNVLDVIVCGDGSGGGAEATIGGSSVQEINFDEGVWHYPPLVSFAGGGGTGAAATVYHVAGSLTNLRVVNGGSGYTQSRVRLQVGATPAADDTLNYEYFEYESEWGPIIVGDVRLSPSHVSSVVETPSFMWQTADETAMNVNPGSPGRVKPFSYGWGYATSAYIEKPDGSQIALAIDEFGTISLSGAVDGFGGQEPSVFVTVSGSTEPIELPGVLSSIGAWEPASIPQPTWLFCDPPIRGAAAVATVSPSGAISITEVGGEYREEPEILRVTGMWPEPQPADVETVPFGDFLLGEGGYRVVDGKMYEWFSETDLVWPLEITTDDHGSGYSRPPRVRISPPKSASDVEPVNFDGRVAVVGVIRGGAGYSTSPTLEIDGPTGSGGTKVTATATATIEGPVVVTLTDGGSGYRTAPDVSFSQPGLAAKAVARIDEYGAVVAIDVNDGGRYRLPPTVTITPVADVESLTITSGGAGYTSAPSVVIAGGGGDGAKATCTINAAGQVDSITLTARGRAFDRPPTVVFVGGGCTTPAAATASIASVGSGATATAKIDGSIIFATVTNGGAYYRAPPSVTIDTASNWRIAASAAALAAGNLSQAEHDAEVARCTGKLTTRMLGRVRDGFDVPHPAPRLPGQAYDQSANKYYYQWLDVPRPDYDRVQAITNLSLHAHAIERTSNTAIASQGSGIRNTGFEPAATCRVGSIAAFERKSGTQLPTYLRSAFWSTLPTVSIEDLTGTGATASLSYSPPLVSIAVQSQGTGYTGWAAAMIHGGVPRSWDNPASAVAVVVNGRVTGITIQAGGAGYLRLPTVLIAGGGGSGAIALPAVLSSSGSIVSIPVEGCGGSGYTSAPTVYIISNDKPFGKHQGDDALQDQARENVIPMLVQWRSEYVVRFTRQQRSLIGWQLPTGNASEHARLWDIYDDNGYVEDVFFENDEAANLDYTPTILIEDGGDDASGAVATAHEVTWSSVPFKRA